MRDAAFLLQNGMPYDVVMSLSPTRRLAWVIAHGEQLGGKFNWNAMQWETNS